MRWLDGITDSMAMGLSRFWGIVKNRLTGKDLMLGKIEGRRRRGQRRMRWLDGITDSMDMGLGGLGE